ncbi:DUF6238 family protein [Streptomyces sp. PTY087I2]|uniref:DUF6238 family protein n=1 Tax=Streptomyces sp. PTY087I2 TaxID=1819298 RepID=UPI00080B26A9|nr:DUF6238 family protein [Streptomyces sp. PTY087I2]OCC11549.1 hypothetical protein A3Q37_02746 [Streptomyces sp. PTY087I2]
MSRTPSTTGQDFVPFATAALDFHRALNLPGGPLVTSRAELDALHAHLVSVHGLLDAHAMRVGQLVPAEGDQLQAARTRLWQAADHVHAAYHAAPRTDSGEVPETDACRPHLPEGAPELTICQRHQRTAHLVRRRTTSADLHAPFTGLVRR